MGRGCWGGAGGRGEEWGVRIDCRGMKKGFDFKGNGLEVFRGRGNILESEVELDLKVQGKGVGGQVRFLI